jgi:hypothetical protein
VRRLPRKSTSRSSAKEPKAATRPTCAELEKSRWARAKTSGQTTAARTERLTASSPGSLALTQPMALDHRLGGTGSGGVGAALIEEKSG